MQTKTKNETKIFDPCEHNWPVWGEVKQQPMVSLFGGIETSEYRQWRSCLKCNMAQYRVVKEYVENKGAK